MKDLDVGTVVYLKKNKYSLYTITKIETINQKTYYWLASTPSTAAYAHRHHERFVHKVKDKKQVENYLYYNSQEYKDNIERQLKEAARWLKDRQEKLKGLTFKRYDTDLWQEQKELLKAAGYFVYDLRDWDVGNGFNIEQHVCVNHIGCWVTDIDLTPYMNEGRWIGIDELAKANIEDIPYKEIKEFINKGKELHFINK